ncbi:hypothetical protein HDV06_006100 [Boothiomyces sp. JEL0866]|nr:hypothetical protein HDV06_006050 [Boothiomyces sp. JEL0866]KAJ3324842.1 hypothetical protein HDV06_006100 [Boothiomyces sp. JEL0866]
MLGPQDSGENQNYQQEYNQMNQFEGNGQFEAQPGVQFKLVVDENNNNWDGQEYDYNGQSNMGGMTMGLQPNVQNDFLSVPGPYVRSRSGSIASNGSIGSYNNDMYLSDAGSDYGEVAPFPGSLVVQVPSPWIQAIHSPLHSPTPSMVSDNGYDNSGSLNDFLSSNNFDQNNSVQYQDFDLFQQNALANSDYSNMQYQNNQTLNFPVAQPLDDLPMESLENEQGPKSTIPDGRFWKVIKNNGQTLYQCPYPDCEKTFTRPYNLKSHYRSHTGERPYVCDAQDCKAAFSRKHDLKRHSKLHSGEKLFKCKACGKSFSRNDALGRHLKPSDQGKESACALRIKLNELEQMNKQL